MYEGENDPYIDESTGILKNLLGITNAQNLESAEYNKSFGNPAMKFKHGALTIWVYRHDLSRQLIMAQDDFKHKWLLMNIANNRKAITKVGTTLGISSRWAQNAYTWLLKKGIAQ